MVAHSHFDPITQNQINENLFFYDVIQLEKIYDSLNLPHDLHPIIGAYCATEKDLLDAKAVAPSKLFNVNFNYKGPKNLDSREYWEDEKSLDERFIEDLKAHKIKLKDFNESSYIFFPDPEKQFEDIYKKVFIDPKASDNTRKKSKKLENKIDNIIKELKEEKVFQKNKSGGQVLEDNQLANEVIENFCQVSNNLRDIFLFIHH